MKIAVLATAGFFGGAGIYAALTAQVAPAAPTPPGNAILASAMDPTVDACEDFYRRACGRYIARARLSEMKPSTSLVGDAFDANLDAGLAALFAADGSGDPELARLKRFHDSCLSPGTEEVPLVKLWLNRIDMVSNQQEVRDLLRQLSLIGIDPFISFSGQPDRAQWATYRGEIHASVPWADRSTVERTFSATGIPLAEADRQANVVVAMVTALRAVRGDRFDAKSAENPMTAQQLERIAPRVDWSYYFAPTPGIAVRTVNVTSPAYVEAVDHELSTRPLEDIRSICGGHSCIRCAASCPRPTMRRSATLARPCASR